jgi:hypothetical protein
VVLMRGSDHHLTRKATREIAMRSIVTPRASMLRALPHEGMSRAKC